MKQLNNFLKDLNVLLFNPVGLKLYSRFVRNFNNRMLKFLLKTGLKSTIESNDFSVLNLLSRTPEEGFMADFNNSIYLLENVEIYGKSGIATYMDKLLLEELAPKTYAKPGIHCNIISLFNKPKEVLIIKDFYVIKIGNNWSNNYFHWIIEELPKITFAMQKTGIAAENICLVSPYELNEFQSKSLNIIGLNNVVQIGNRLIRAEKYITFSPTRHQRENKRSYPSKALIDSLRTNMELKFEYLENQPETICMISRGKTNGRALVSEQKIYNKLKGAGYEVKLFDPGNYDFEGQAAISRTYKYFIGAHGAALTNIIWSNDATLIELFGERTTNLSYEAICRVLKFQYRSINGKDVRRKIQPKNRQDFYVDPDQVLEMVRMLNIKKKYFTN